MHPDPVLAQTGELPTHIAIIMDGNGRWAKARGLARVAGHRKGADAVRTVVRACGEIGIDYLTLFAFSSENWSRPADEVSDLMGLLRLYLRRELADLHANDVRLRVMGDRARLDKDIVDLIEDAEAKTADNAGLNLIIALNYGARDEIVHAARMLAAKAVAGRIAVAEIDEAAVADALYMGDVPDPDLIIRTSGEQRLSNFMLWQAAYAELIFVPTPWPSFSREDLEQVIDEYRGRERRFGGLGQTG